MGRLALFALLVVVAAGAAACGDSDDTPLGMVDAPVAVDAPPPTPDAFALAAPADRAALFTAGPYAVGYRTATLTYRPDGVAADRTLKLDVWYPATPGSGEDTVYSVAGVVTVPRPGPRTGAAPLADGRFPLVVYSHGSGGVALAAFSYGEYFASWGIAFVAPDHTGNTVLDRSNSFALNFLVRPQDISATIDWAGADPASPVAGRLSGDVAAIGHSFGGYTVLSLLGARGDWATLAAGCPSVPDPASCAIYADPAARAALDAGFRDPRVELAIAQAPVVLTFAPGELAAIDRPVEYVTARRDLTLPWSVHGQPGWERLDGADDLWIDLLNAGHYSVVAVCDVVSPMLLAAVGLNVGPDGCDPDFTPISELVPALTAYAHAFIRLHALGEARWRDVLGGAPFHADIAVTVGAN